MNAQLIALAINSAFQVIAGLRRYGMANQEINARLARVDSGEQAITVAEVKTKEEDWQRAIDEGRALDESDRVPLDPILLEDEEGT